jgi:hypothetical protein
MDAAMKGAEGVGKFRKENLVAIEPRLPNFVREQYDSQWATNFDSMKADDAAMEYWTHGQSKAPVPELLLSGTFSILGTKVRMRAYERIMETDPNSLAMLELARLAVEFESDLGAVTPFVVNENNVPILASIMRYDEREGTQIWERALRLAKEDKTFPINWKDAKPLTTRDPKYDAAFSVPNFKGLMKPLRIEKAEQIQEFIDGILS